MTLFSERYGYLNPREVIIRGQITEPILNSILNWILIICEQNYHKSNFNFRDIERQIWVYFLNQRLDRFQYNSDVVKQYLLSNEYEWYRKLDLLEYMCAVISNQSPQSNLYIKYINSEFERHNFVYRYVDGHIVEITSQDEIEAIDRALVTPINGVKTHIQAALKLMSASKGEPDYRNSIKESISAVECLCREITGASTLDDALKNLVKKGISINSQLRKGFENLYYYTNDKRTGVRHALMDDVNAPTSAEATYMLVTCSAFINYVNAKIL